jgi:hypothetical protein
MKRTRSQIATQSDGDSDLDSTSGDLHGPSSLHRSSSTSKRKALATSNISEPLHTDVLQLARPSWPANDEVTPGMSLRKIRELQNGNEEEKLMAAFARHVIKPGRFNRAGCWVSKRSLRKIFSERFDHHGFVVESKWKSKRASDFGLPSLFFRAVDD